ncbi:primary replicative DNA helicase [Paenibacillus sophorae]|uniref:Replicative DNA helicase n=1 Tax=Paenibacillus sophorae TaxID=1333845 RepID=A0A1H8LAU7_9BACL|nr:replicative DNA helicase [Paenibacillus sophorae]QWU17357.1 replicative DNA helicase [Paenibacillus sophorae]SEO02189.1 primary replicative DNA helicase [Paenibacillus sophorae]
MLERDDLLEKLGIEKPVDLQAEQAVLGASLIDQAAYDTVADILQGGEFSDDGHARIYRAMRRLSDAGQPIDLVSLTSQLQDSEEIEKVGGVSYLAKLAHAVPTTTNATYYAERVQEMFLRRQAIDTAMDLLRNAGEEQDVKGFLAMAETAVSKLSDQTVPVREFVGIKDALMQVWEEAEQRYNVRDINRGITGIESGYADLDRMTAGFQDNDLIIVAARPSVGKTAFALNIAQNVGVRAKVTVAIFSLEMSAAQLVQRMVCAESQIDASRMRTGRFEGDDWERMATAVGSLSEADIHIDDTPGITVNEIRAKCRRLKKDNGLGMILIDYLQLIQGSGRRGANRQEEVSQISRTLKQIARELEVPVIALSQLSRGVEQRQDKRPMMSDLRESGAIEQDADIVAFLYRDDYYDKESEKKNIIEVIIAKQRNGPVGTVELVFLKEFNKFVNYERSHADQSPPPAGNVKNMDKRKWA